MTLIEGIGDEVVLFLAIALIVGILAVLWIFPFPQTQFVSNSSSFSAANEISSNHRVDAVHLNNTTASNSSNSEQISSEIFCDDSNIPSNTTTNSALVDNAERTVENSDANCHQNTVATTSDARISSELSEDPNFLRKRRLEFFNQQSSLNDNELMTELDNINNESGRVASSQEQETDVHIQNESNDILDNEMVRLRLKYLNDTERVVQCKLDDKIGDFKRCHFAEDIANNKIVRLIYNGQLLRMDDRTLESYGVTNSSVIHVQISQNQQAQGSSYSDSDSDLDLSHLMWPLFGIILGIIWMLHFQYREFFNIVSTVALVGITGLFLMVLWSQSNLHNPIRRQENQQTNS
ncbi:transmembrane and ubiquitin-like domain-containing protein 1 [Centruroides vittatus]|uniref:transmembrane and ubiquitin-like domain-containing protein 1 n=1 Tax=Centruroides vittatus TaxID=120091 RepID=UPI0035106C42